MGDIITNENIQLSLPVNAAYVSAARLTASSIAFRMGFDIDDIEDIKAAVSEACTFIIKKSKPTIDNEFKISFTLKKGTLDIDIFLKESVNDISDDSEMSLIVIKALVDKLTLDKTEDKISSLHMTKTIKESLFG